MPAIYCVKLSFPSAYTDVRFIADETNDGWKVEVKTEAMGVDSSSPKNLYRAWQGVESSNDLIQGSR